MGVTWERSMSTATPTCKDSFKQQFIEAGWGEEGRGRGSKIVKNKRAVSAPPHGGDMNILLTAGR